MTSPLNALKRITPRPLKILYWRGRALLHRSRPGYRFSTSTCRLRYLRYKYRHRPQHEFYAALMRLEARRDPKHAVGGLWDEIGRNQFNFLVQQGLQPPHRLLDIGCGCLRGGLHLIRYLEDGHYTGLDISPELLDAGRRFLAQAGLEAKRPVLHLTHDLHFAEVQDQVYEFVLAQSVFTHMPLSDIEECFQHIGKAMKAASVFFATYFETDGEPFASDRLGFAYPFALLHSLGKKHGLQVERVDNFVEPRGVMKMLRITPSKKGTPDPSFCTGRSLVFIVGCPRSGTTWLQRLLASHPRIRTGQETHLFSAYIIPQLRIFRQHLDPERRGGLGLGCYFTEQEFIRILKSYLVQLLAPLVGSLRPGEIFLEKSPTHTLVIPDILEFLPECRIIHILRDPRDVVASLLAASGASWGKDWAPKDPRHAAELWAEYFRAGRAAKQILPAWQFHEVRYEDLQQVPEKVLHGCADFLGLDWDNAGLAEAIRANRPDRAVAGDGGTAIPVHGEVASRSAGSVREPNGFVRKATVGSWKTDLSLRDRFEIWRALRKLMNEAGYPWPYFFSNRTQQTV